MASMHLLAGISLNRPRTIQQGYCHRLQVSTVHGTLSGHNGILPGCTLSRHHRIWTASIARDISHVTAFCDSYRATVHAIYHTLSVIFSIAFARGLLIPDYAVFANCGLAPVGGVCHSLVLTQRVRKRWLLPRHPPTFRRGRCSDALQSINHATGTCRQHRRGRFRSRVCLLSWAHF